MELSKLWKYGMSSTDKEYYTEFSRQAREKYALQLREYQSTGSFTPSKDFEKLQGTGPWVRKMPHLRNALEQEICSYDKVRFPPRPHGTAKPSWVTKIELQTKRQQERIRLREQ